MAEQRVVLQYETDLSEEQWQLVEPLLPPAKFGGRPRSTPMRRVLEAIFYLVKTGCHWRMLPIDFPPWRTVYGYCAEWSENGTLRRVQRSLYFKVREREGRNPQPSVAIIDSQTVPTGKMGGVRGYDGGKKKKGRKRHVVVDVLGMMLGARVTAANDHDTNGGIRALRSVSKFLRKPSFKRIYADKGYQGERFAGYVDQKFDGAVVQIGENKTNIRDGFVPDKQRWVVERTFAWLFDYRRLTIDYERLIVHSQGMMRLAAIRTMIRRLVPEPFPKW
jgi:putative transposase